MVFGIRLAKVNGNSMQPLFNNGDYILYRGRFLNPGKGDVILFERENALYIKRVYGLPGDTVEITEKGLVLINGAPLGKKNIQVMGETKSYDMKGAVTLNDSEYFVLGDNRTVSKDSRNAEIGVIHEQQIKGISILPGV